MRRIRRAWHDWQVSQSFDGNRVAEGVDCMTTEQAVALGVPRWMVLAMPQDVDQIVALANLPLSR